MIATAGPSALWYLTRGTGLVTLVCLTASVVLGIVQVRRWTPAGSPRYVVVALHRGISLLVVALLAVHVVTAVLDSFAPIRLLDAVVPFTSAYRPLWLGLGALALDGLLALTITSLLRHRLGLRAWRAVHWIAYACWPVALAHGWGTGSDARTAWMLALTLGCAAAVLGALAWRLASGWAQHPRVRGAAAAATLVTIGGLGAWLVLGPLAPGWARRAGTPPKLLGSAVRARPAAPTPTPAPVPALEQPFTAALRGSLHQGVSRRGSTVVDLRLRLSGGAHGVLRIRLAGQSDSHGGVLMSRSAVTLGPSWAPGSLQGRIDALRELAEALVGSADGHAMRLRVDLALAGSGARDDLRTAGGLVTGLPRLLAGVHGGHAVGLAEHRALHGDVDEAVLRGDRLIAAVAAAGLRGRGGAGFPTAVKLRAVAAAPGGGGGKAVVVNGTEGEPMSAKDRVLLSLAPHLVLDGARLAAEAVGARRIVLAVTEEDLGRALGERPDLRGASLATVPGGYLAGEESALLQRLNGGPAKPTTVPPRPHERGLGRRPTLVSNAETLAHLALIARHGADWFRAVGPPDHPGSALVTLAGAVEQPGVTEVALGTPIAALVGARPRRALLVGGYHGTWIAGDATLDDPSLAAFGASVGTGAIVALPDSACPVAEVARIVAWMAEQSAGQCGPCVHGLRAIAATVGDLADGAARPGALDDLRRWCRELPGRGACHHPDGVVRFLRSALEVFAPEWDDHRRHGPCDACGGREVLAA